MYLVAVGAAGCTNVDQGLPTCGGTPAGAACLGCAACCGCSAFTNRTERDGCTAGKADVKA